ncbi:hypothetical protein LSAT2_010566 [Lamellibrachia satsuma]|nr:hypothetical protein LSAT2_010566 [Lamellibrachia satsuma]
MKRGDWVRRKRPIRTHKLASSLSYPKRIAKKAGPNTFVLEDGSRRNSRRCIRSRLLNTWCNVEYRKFNTTGYPPFVKNLLNYAWKPIIIQEVLRQYPAVFWMDASFRWKTPNMTQLYQRARDSDGFVLFGTTGHSNFAVTHLGMYSYLPTNVVRQKRTEQFGATSAFVVNTRSNYDEVLFSYYLCALTQDCIASMTNRFCKFSKDRYGSFAKCHRFDQSLANLLLSNRWCYNSTRYSLLDSSLFAIERSVTSHFKIKVCKKAVNCAQRESARPVQNITTV